MLMTRSFGAKILNWVYWLKTGGFIFRFCWIFVRFFDIQCKSHGQTFLTKYLMN